MSYEPKLLIRKSHLELNRRVIERSEDDESIKSPQMKAAWADLRKALSVEPVVFPEIEIVIISPELTKHNENVRKLLDTLKIDYRTYW